MSKWTNTGALVVSDEAGGGGGGGPVTNDGTFAAETGGNLDEIAASTAAAASSLAGAVSVDDNGGSLTVDGAVSGTGFFATVSTDIVRPPNITTYAINEAFANATPTAGGFTLANAARESGKSGIITDLVVTSSDNTGTLLQGEIWIFNQAVTAITDNSAFGVTDAEIKTCVGMVPFVLIDAGDNSFYHAQGLNIGFTCVGTANLRFLVRVKNAYTPASGEVLTVIAKCIQVD